MTECCKQDKSKFIEANPQLEVVVLEWIKQGAELTEIKDIAKKSYNSNL